MKKFRVAVITTTKEYIENQTKNTDSPEDALEELDSQNGAKAYLEALSRPGREVFFHEGNFQLADWLAKLKPDICFNVSEGYTGADREAQIPAILELMGLPYTGPAPLAAAITLNKPETKIILDYYGIATPLFQVLSNANDPINKRLRYPLFVKPVHEGTGIGIDNKSIVQNDKELRKQVRAIIKKYGEPALVETYLPGCEFTCGLVGNGKDAHIFPISEIDFSGYKHNLAPIYGINQKIYYADEYKNKIPAPISKTLANKIRKMTLDTVRVTGARDYARVDFRLDQKGNPYVLEINALPGITQVSDLTLMAASEGWDYKRLVNEVLQAGIKRYPHLNRSQ